MSKDWSKTKLVPMSNLLAWHNLDLTSGGLEIPDYSGNERHYGTELPAPAIQEDVINGCRAVYFNDDNPLVYSEEITIKHAFIVAALEDEEFAGNEGLFSDTASHSILIGGGAGTTKFNNQSIGFDYSYRKADVSYSESSQQAPVDSRFAVIELQFPAGFTLDGLQIGQDMGNASRRWKGWWAEDVFYGAIKDDFDRKAIYEYFAMKFHLWQENKAGLYVFPFVANKARSLERDREIFLSEPYTGDKKALLRGNLKRDFDLPFALRRQEEYDAAEAFHAEHYPLGQFIFRDYRHYPFKERTLEFTSAIREQGTDVSFRFNYSFEAKEV